MNELWERALKDLEGQLSRENFETWLAPVRCVGIEGDTVTLRIPNKFFQDWLSAHYLSHILDSLHRETERDGVSDRERRHLERESLSRDRRAKRGD